MAAVASESGLTCLSLSTLSPEDAIRRLKGGVTNAERNDASFDDLAKRFGDYARGGRQLFPDELDLSSGTPFQQDVWRASRTIPYGETRSYGWVAHTIGRPRAARGVGQAMGRNPLLIIIPCHRVVAGNGIGGFGQGLDMKRTLMGLEGE